uniref:Uncharacterized protein n=1 Tax=Anguilla anguilla TaxID=7936 RepID=A0A0E9WR51_ANGAN
MKNEMYLCWGIVLNGCKCSQSYYGNAKTCLYSKPQVFMRKITIASNSTLPYFSNQDEG